MRKTCKIVMLLIIMSVLIFPVVAVDNSSVKDPITYRILIDQNYGFFRTFEMYNKISGNDIVQENGTLNIFKGDTVIFVSDTIPDRMLTIISEEKLWSDKNGVLKYGGKEFSYVFNKSGIYNMYIKERPLLKEKIIVGPLDINDTGIIGTNDTKTNLTNGTKSIQTNVTKVQNSTNTTGLNSTTKSDQNNTVVIKQNSTTNKSESVPIVSISLADGLFSKIKSKSDVSILTVILLGIYILSARIKDD